MCLGHWEFFFDLGCCLHFQARLLKQSQRDEKILTIHPAPLAPRGLYCAMHENSLGLRVRVPGSLPGICGKGLFFPWYESRSVDLCVDSTVSPTLGEVKIINGTPNAHAIIQFIGDKVSF